MRLTPLWWAAIATIRIEPDYRFVGGERRMAERMLQRGLLLRRPKNHYVVTVKGRRLYDQDPTTLALKKRSARS